jgi:glycosyltransferase involved in cell wall biosynthesis
VDARREGDGDVRKPGVLVIHNRYRQPGGEDTVVGAEVALLRQHGHRVVEFVRDNAAIDGYGPLHKASLMLSATWNQRVYAELRQIIRKERPDVAHCHNLMPLISPSAYYACHAEGVPVVQTLHNFRLSCPAGTLFRKETACNDCDGKLGRAVVRGCYRNSSVQTAAVSLMLGTHRAIRTFETAVDGYSAPSRFCVERMVGCGIPHDKITLRPNFLLNDPGQRDASGDYVIFVGRLCAEKGIRQLLWAWRRLRRIPLIIVGDGPLRHETESYIERNGMESVCLTGALPPAQTLARLKRARFLMFPSIGYETFGMTVLEAAACGIAALGSRLGAIPELVDEGKTGLLFDPHDTDELAGKAEWAWSHPEAMNEMGTAARTQYLQKYTAKRNYEALVATYGSVLGDSPSSGAFGGVQCWAESRGQALPTPRVAQAPL